MIQRIQTVYLLVATILIGSVFAYPLAELLSSDGQVFIYSFNGLSIENEEGLYLLTIPPIILLGITALMPIASLFLYKKRIIQMRLNSFNIMLLLGYVGLNYYYIHNFSKQLDGVVSYQITAIFPFVAAVLTYLAIRAIGKDEALIRSMDRIR
ncbi:MAG: DUF4293 domain-containing protein [Bacteroidales bacterium]|jgi:hypothetical protein|nr:DUF4293 domain-containing protein [Bacteroidales bacterium]